ncbi:hypothetical protein BOX15_Mlig005068g1 [Macrostomum lignano]|uniref:Uncharacterized protein n=2 Tax=Macrostomum lignano TaxID=282301 RepID=A0A1I8H5X4_9PLAT|nr:hypothetical protein BOX15_Mlig005068g3 [Macrostomum lignano]PAA83254.1 hypothetical protein BOX15_Mlig005068g1 [Macrostomum lignano]
MENPGEQTRSDGITHGNEGSGSSGAGNIIPTDEETSLQAVVGSGQQAQVTERRESPIESGGRADRLSSLKDKDREIQSLIDQIKSLTAENSRLQQANANLAKELQHSRSEVRLLLDRLDKLNARIGRLDNRPNAVDLASDSLCCVCGQGLATEPQDCSDRRNNVSASHWLDAASRKMINSQIALLDARAKQLGEPHQFVESYSSLTTADAELSSRAPGTPDGGSESPSSSQQSIERRMRSLDDRIQELIGKRPYGTGLADDAECSGGIATSTPMVSSRPFPAVESMSGADSVLGPNRIYKGAIDEPSQDDTMQPP